MQKVFEVQENDARLQPANVAWRPLATPNVFAISWKRTKRISFYDSIGRKLNSFELPKHGTVTALEWSTDGRILAIAQTEEEAVALWDMQSNSLSWIDINGRNVTLLRWCPLMPILAVATLKGAVLMYNATTHAQQIISGVHLRAVLCGTWSTAPLLALGSEDKLISLTSLRERGDSRSFRTDDVPRQISFSKALQPHQQSALAVVVGAANLVLVYDADDTSRPIAVSLDKGLVRHIDWTDHENLLIGYSSGYLVVLKVRLHEKQVDTVFCDRLFAHSIEALCYSNEARRLAVAGDTKLKLLSPNKWSSAEIVALDASSGGPVNFLRWSPDGDLLSLTTSAGRTACYSRRRFTVAAAYDTKILHSTSLLELALFDVRDESFPSYRIQVDFEVSLGAVGPRHCALVSRTRVYYYSYSIKGTQDNPQDGERLHPRLSLLFPEAIADVALGDAKAAVLAGGKVHLHDLEESGEKPIIPQALPNKDRKASATACAFVDSYLLVAHSGHYVTCFSVTYKTGIVEVAHCVSVSRLFPSSGCALVAFTDCAGDLHVYNSYTDLRVKAEIADGLPQTVLWDVLDPTVFVVHVGAKLITYVLNQNHIYGERVEEVKTLTLGEDGAVVACQPCHSEVPENSIPLTLANGILHYKEPTGRVATLCLATHSAVVVEHKGWKMEKGLPKFLQLVALNKLEDAFEVAKECLGKKPVTNSASPLGKKVWTALGKAALERTDLHMAQKAFRQIPVPATLWWLKDIRELTEEMNILRGHILVLLEDYERAEESFLKSTQPKMAVDLLQDLHQWERAIQLAEELDPPRLPSLHLSFAKSLESEEHYEAALRHYEEAREMSRSTSVESTSHPLVDFEGGGACNIHEVKRSPVGWQTPARSLLNDEKLWNVDVVLRERDALAGIARCAIRTGETNRGMQTAVDTGDRDLLCRCAEILEERKELPEAASLCEKAGFIEKAADLYIRGLQLDKAASLVTAAGSPKLHQLLAEAKERLEDFESAVEHYKTAKNFSAAVKILLNNLNQEEAAFDLVRHEKSTSAAEILAHSCIQRGKIRHAIEFLLFAGKIEDALRVAEAQQQMDAFVQHAAEPVSPMVHQRIARYYESQRLPGKAAYHYACSGETEKAVQLYIEGGQGWYDAATSLAVRVRDKNLTKILEDHFRSDPRNLPHLARLYDALGNHAEAATVSCQLAKRQQREGHYKVARDNLLDTVKNLRARRIPIPDDVCLRLHILHCYFLVEKLTKADCMEAAAQLLDMLAKHIDEFEGNAAVILTSAVLTCHKIGKRGQAYSHACQLLVNHTYQQSIPERHRRLIETVARKPPSDECCLEEEEPPSSPCPFCKAPQPDFVLRCSVCKKIAPFCIASGKRVLSDDCAWCPQCRLPGRASFLERLLSTHPACPMCEESVKCDELLRDATAFSRTEKNGSNKRMSTESSQGQAGQSGAVDVEDMELLRSTVRLVEEAFN